MKFSETSKLGQIAGAFPVVRLISGGDYLSGGNAQMTMQDLHEKNPTWGIGDMLYGLERLQEVEQSGREYVYALGGIGEGAQMLYLPAGNRVHEEYAILLSGGAYGAVCTLAESLPVAARLNELGYDAFCLNYHTATAESFVTGLMPQPLDDLAAAVKKAGELVGHMNYFAGGFSAGGHVAALWGTEHLGARKYGLPQPKLLMLDYPLITLSHFPEPVKDFFAKGLFGANCTDADIAQYDVSRHVDTAYPKTYIARAADDTTVSLLDAQNLMEAMNRAGVANRMETAETGNHGYGLGTDTPLNGWVERALNFMESIVPY